MKHAFAAPRTISLILLSCFALSACGGGGGGGVPPNPNEPPDGASVWVLDPNDIVDGGPGPDGIPALSSPAFGTLLDNEPLDPGSRVIVLRVGDEVRAYPHDIMDWHEIVNDGPPDAPLSMSYCPLTGSALAWKGDPDATDPSFGVSGLLYNSNLLPYDRETGSLWSQMLEISINGPRVLERPERIQLIETSWGTLVGMYPDAQIMTRDTGFVRNYDEYPYDDYRENANLLFPVRNVDNRMHPKTRVIGIRQNAAVGKVYQLGAFGDMTLVINDTFADEPIVVVGNTPRDFAAIYSRELEDGTILDMSALQDQLPNVMTDTEGNVWDVFGMAVSGPRAGTQLGLTNAYTAFWFAWVAHIEDTEIHFN